MSYSRFCQKFGVKLPVIQAPMAGISTIELAREVGRSGLLASIAASMFDLRSDIDKFRDTLSQYPKDLPVNLNFFSHEIAKKPTQQQINNWFEVYNQIGVADPQKIDFGNKNVSFREYDLEVVNNLIKAWNDIGIAPNIISFHFGIPLQPIIKRLKQTGASIFATASTVKEVQILLENEIDGLILQGTEAGGHRGIFTPDDDHLSCRELFEATKKFLMKSGHWGSIFVVPAGGIVSSPAIRRFFDDGASAVLLGTLFLTCPETSSNNYIRSIVAKKEVVPTVMTNLVSGRYARALETPFLQKLEQSYQGQELPEYGYLYKAYTTWKPVADTKDDLFFYLVGSNYTQMPIFGRPAKEVCQYLLRELSRYTA